LRLKGKKDLEQYCENGSSKTYASTEQDKVTRTQGGYSNLITVTEHFVCKIPKNLKPEEVGKLCILYTKQKYIAFFC